ncbi:AraC family transcriptional regulator [Pararoseomonas indoligenes]|uniref:AraC family transcriptional regulator n=1 Tax=Roseomonas indoligenes TaxID=2820811 RepID=A0A940N266_9PROT|nr:AraC family transcriptional regulator [Pararoseomonas indoligenes]MBP0495392.1 AraC family transcriptional regulator [Pararoseomonas indoligenes]
MPDGGNGLPSSDLMSELLLGMRLRGIRYHRIRAVPPFGFGFDGTTGSAHFHFVANGTAFLRLADGTVHPLEAGSAAFLPRGGKHQILSSPDIPCPGIPCEDIASYEAAPICDGVSAVHAPGCTEAAGGTVIFSGCMEFQLGGMQGLVRLMPPAMLVGILSERHPELLPVLSAMEQEACGQRVGFAGILARLAEVVAATIVRGWVECGCGGASGLVEALGDPRLARAIGALHRDPGRDWTVAALAAESGASRSVFAERFQAVIGLSPLRYATELRMRLATQWITQDRVPIDTAAQRLGYASQAAFSRAFKRVTGRSPGAVRQ